MIDAVMLAAALLAVPAAADQANDPAFAVVVRAALCETGQGIDTDNNPPIGTVRYLDEVDNCALAPARTAEPIKPSRPFEPDWGNDVLVHSGSPFPGDHGRLSIDHAANGDIYVGVMNWSSAPQDTFRVYRSTDEGVTWQLWSVSVNLSGSDTIVDGKVLVGAGANPWVYMFVHYSTSGGGLYCRKLRADGTGNTWQYIIRGDSVRRFDVDRNIEGSPAMFLAYWQNPPDYSLLRLFASYDDGATWTNGRSVHSGAATPTSVCAGGDGYVYLCWIDNDVTPWVGRYTNNLVSPSYVFNHPDSVAGDFAYQPSVAAARNAPGASQKAWILNRHKHTNGNYDLHVSFSTDGGATWATRPWPPTNEPPRTEWDMRWPTLRYPYDYAVPMVVASATLCGAFDSVKTAYSHAANSDTWGHAGWVVINDHQGTGAFPSVIDAPTSTNGRAVAYRQYGSDKVWIDYYDNPTAVAERPEPSPAMARLEILPNPVVGRATIRFAVPLAGPVELAVFDVAGRQVAEMASATMGTGGHSVNWNSATVEPGVYLLRLRSAGQSAARRFVVTR